MRGLPAGAAISGQYDLLAQAGYRLEIDEARTAELYQPRQALPGQGIDTIPGYPCYRTVEETTQRWKPWQKITPAWRPG